MSRLLNIARKMKPSVSRHNLLFIAGLAWTTAGGILLWRALAYLLPYGDLLFWRISGAALLGGVFFLALFAKISRKHIRRIRGLNIPYPCAFSFFSLKSYAMMAVMITGGVLMRSTELVDKAWLHTFFITMAVPLLISAAGFFYAWAGGKEVK